MAAGSRLRHQMGVETHKAVREFEIRKSGTGAF